MEKFTSRQFWDASSLQLTSLLHVPIWHLHQDTTNLIYILYIVPWYFHQIMWVIPILIVVSFVYLAYLVFVCLVKDRSQTYPAMTSILTVVLIFQVIRDYIDSLQGASTVYSVRVRDMFKPIPDSCMGQYYCFNCSERLCDYNSKNVISVGYEQTIQFYIIYKSTMNLRDCLPHYYPLYRPRDSSGPHNQEPCQRVLDHLLPQPCL